MFPVCDGLMHVEKSKNSIMGKVFSWFCECKKTKSQTVDFKTQVKKSQEIYPVRYLSKNRDMLNNQVGYQQGVLLKELRPLYTPGLKKKIPKPLVTPPTHHQFLRTCPSLGLRKT